MSDGAQLLVSQVLTVLATSVAAITIARTLEPADWAVFSALLGLSVALTLVADFGIGTWLLRELSSELAEGKGQEPNELSRLVGAGVLVNAVVALPLLIGALAWWALAGPDVAVVAALVSLLVYGALIASANALEAPLRAQRRVRLVLSASVIEKSLLVILLLGVAATGAGLAAIGLAYLAAGLTRIVFDGVILFARDRVPVPRPSSSAALQVARASMPFALNAASLNLIPRLDTIVLVLLSTTSAAWFAIGDRLLGPALIVPAALGSALYPFMATRAAKHRRRGSSRAGWAWQAWSSRWQESSSRLPGAARVRERVRGCRSSGSGDAPGYPVRLCNGTAARHRVLASSRALSAHTRPRHLRRRHAGNRPRAGSGRSGARRRGRRRPVRAAVRRHCLGGVRRVAGSQKRDRLKHVSGIASGSCPDSMTTYADRIGDLTFRVPGWAIAVASAAVAGVLGWGYVTHPTLALLPALFLLALPLVLSAKARSSSSCSAP